MTRTAKWRAVPLATILTATSLAAAQAAMPPDVAGWVARTTSLSPAQVAIVGPESVYSLEPMGPPTATGEVVARVRTEPLADDWGKTHGFMSWEAHFLFDCGLGRLREIRGATYPERNLKGGPKADAPREDWISPDPSQPAAQLLAAACDAGFAWPLRNLQVQTAAAAPAPPALRPAPQAPAPAAAPPVRVAAATAGIPDKPIPYTPAPDKAAPDVAATDRSASDRPFAVAPTGFAVQIARGPSEAGAREALKRARHALGADGEGLVETAEESQLGRNRRYTAVLSGFRTIGAASRACARLTGAGQSCYVLPPDADRAEAPAPALAQDDAPPPPAQPAAATASGSYAVQIARGPSEAGARIALGEARKTLGRAATGLTATVEPSQDRGRRRFTAVLAGFATEAAALEACQRLHDAGQTCFKRAAKWSSPAAATD